MRMFQFEGTPSGDSIAINGQVRQWGLMGQISDNGLGSGFREFCSGFLTSVLVIDGVEVLVQEQ